MPVALEPIKRFKCTYADCTASFDTVTQMRRHKAYSEHDYCEKCDKDFEDFEDLMTHKILNPQKHNKACRVCGQEFKSTAGLKRHIEISHKMDQQLPCPGCESLWPNAARMIEHLEYGHCEALSAEEFCGYIVHKYLIAELLHGENHLQRFFEKVQQYDATVDQEACGGVSLLDDTDIPLESQVDESDPQWKVLQPENVQTPLKTEHMHSSHYPPLPSPSKQPPSNIDATDADLATELRGMSLHQRGESVVSSTLVSEGESKTWIGSQTARTLFPDAVAIAPSEWSVEEHDRLKEATEGINIMNTRFWDPLSDAWNPERFYNPVADCYICPFVCEQKFGIHQDLETHITDKHRITRMRCPRCLALFDSCHRLVAHCESGSRKCKIRTAGDFPTFLDRITGGFLGVEDAVRPDHANTPAIEIFNPITRRNEMYRPPIASYLKYSVTKPMAYQEEERKRRGMITIGGQQPGNRGLH
ncbi:hypothetical protein M011DRAFT_478223 [Sporormia fimetaria CBS 119925]|uniref:C2H2-type domain-containing protein n=1 Tax=Sporormia fimetaria CBS 119925 TaxID=1340428 RepID=A0A6A6V6U9_9PLEO|nr:hypothetical protein M011DRAFT_478223 [Sporormia fimetaria CBS 119925]